MLSILPSRAMARRARQYLLLGVAVLLAGLVLAALGLLLIIIPFTVAGWYDALRVFLVGVGLVIALVGAVMIIRSFVFPKDNLPARFTAEGLARGLDNRYTFIRNISRRGLGYIDAVLVGPNGALVFYFVDRPGTFFCEGEVWLTQKKSGMLPAKINPTREVVKDVEALRQYLAELDLENVPVYAIVVFVHKAARVTARNPVTPVSHVQDVLAILGNGYLAQERISRTAVDAVVRALTEE